MAVMHTPREPPLERWSPRGTDAAARLRSWSEILAATHLAFEIEPTWRTPTRFQAAVTRRAVGDLMLVGRKPLIGSNQFVVGWPQ